MAKNIWVAVKVVVLAGISGCGDCSDSQALDGAVEDGSPNDAPGAMDGSADADLQPAWSYLSSHGIHSCGIWGLPWSPGALYCWGDDTNGQLGQATVGGDSPVPLRVGADDDWAYVAAGLHHSCGIRVATPQDTTGALYCWGSNGSGQLGIGSTSEHAPPTEVSGTSGWSQVAVGAFHTCGIKLGRLYCWGTSGDGRLGTSAAASNPTPLAVGELSTWQMVAAGGSHSCGIAAGALYCWGQDVEGQLGNGEGGGGPALQRVGEDSNWSSVAAGDTHTCGLKETGQLYCWGSNERGQLGIGTDVPAPAPALVDDDDTWTSVAAGNLSNTCGVKAARIYCWGSNLFGQLGLDPDLDQQPHEAHLEPVAVGDVSDWEQVGLGNVHACGRRGGVIACWGRNIDGQLGDNTMDTRFEPGPIDPPSE